MRLDALYRELPHSRDEQKKIQALLCQYHQFVSRVLFDQQVYDEAIAHLDKALFFAEALNDEELIALTFHRRGWMQPFAGHLQRGLEDYEKAKSY